MLLFGVTAGRMKSSVVLSLIGAASLVLTTSANHGGGLILRRLAPSLAWLADACVPALLTSALIYVAIAPARRFARPYPGTDWARLRRLGALTLGVWLAGSALAALGVGHWITYTNGLASVVGFVVVAPLAEELLFRGAIFELAERVWPQVPAAAIGVSAVLFGIHHLDLHHFVPTPAALGQVAFTLPSAWSSPSFGAVRAVSGPGWRCTY
jgi:membrane protease YdiL (CAAX protease family)